MILVPWKLLEVVVPGAKKPRGILLLKLESSDDDESLGEDASKQGRIDDIDADDDITLVNDQHDADNEMFDLDALNGEEVFVKEQVTVKNVVEEVVDVAQVSTALKTATISTEEITLAQALESLKTSKPKEMKLKEFDSIQEMFDGAFKRVNTFEDFRIEMVEGKENRAGEELIQESSNKQKVEDNKETAKL
uniref:Uncharacterized protein n=1 Tax=Tanacetum cinerariifolium TaxID=118510 RepID=A0A6L2L0R4_TANCI|nr:hypothetical protein [Tanacetum cinerariifolium]